MSELLELERASLIRDCKAQASDPIDRYRKLAELGKAVAADIKQAKAEALMDAKVAMSWRQVGAEIGVSGSRAEQIANGR